MFTGLVEGLGRIVSADRTAHGLDLRIEGPAPTGPEGSAAVDPATDRGRIGDPVRIGESVAIDGCCLTVTAVDVSGRIWSFQAGAETLSKTALSRRAAGDRVNVERAFPANARLGGHFVQGHVDGTATVAEVVRRGEWVDMTFALSPELARGLVPKGSVAVDGVSLTVVEAGRDRFSVALVPHTLAVTSLGFRRPGDPVNIETDVLGKYVARLLAESGTIPASASVGPAP
jgi:riboflavin synthase